MCPKRICGSPSPQNCECDLNWKTFYRCHQVRTRSLRWVLIQSDQCPLKKEIWTRTHKADNAMWIYGYVRKMVMWKQRQRLKLCCHKMSDTCDHWKLEKAPLGSMALPISWFWMSNLKNYKTVHFCCIKPLIFWCRTRKLPRGQIRWIPNILKKHSKIYGYSY